MRRTISLVVLASVLAAGAVMCVIPAITAETMPNEAQSLARMLWGSRATDVWSNVSVGKDSLSYKFIFVSPDSTDTLDVTPAGGWFTSDVQCTLSVYGDSTLWIDFAPQVIKAGEGVSLNERVRWIHVGISGAGLQRAKVYAQ